MTQELIERLREVSTGTHSDVTLHSAKASIWLSKAADALQSQSARIAELEGAMCGLVQAVEMDAHENNSISGYTGARLSDARNALTKDSTSG